MQRVQSAVSGKRSTASVKSFRPMSSKKSYVDDTLFGSKPPSKCTIANKDAKGQENVNKKSNAPLSVAAKTELREKRAQAEKINPESAMISKVELERIKNSAKIQTKEQEAQQRILMEEQKDQ